MDVTTDCITDQMIENLLEPIKGMDKIISDDNTDNNSSEFKLPPRGRKKKAHINLKALREVLSPKDTIM